jgi:hypothetical protein
MARSVWHVGSKGDIWLVEEGSGEGERGPGGALVDQEQRGGLLHNILLLK